VPRDGHIFLNILIITSVYVLMIFNVFQKLSLPFTIINFLFASLKLLTSFRNGY
jgi:hypothetical protein